jgi:hypothetical protein
MRPLMVVAMKLFVQRLTSRAAPPIGAVHNERSIHNLKAGLLQRANILLSVVTFKVIQVRCFGHPMVSRSIALASVT